MTSNRRSDGIVETTYTDPDTFDLPFGLKMATFFLGSPENADRPAFVITRFPPNVTVPRHSHAAEFCDVIVEGSVKVGDTWYPKGSVRHVPPGVVYGPTTSGPEGCIMLEFYARDSGRPADIPEGALTEEMQRELAAFAGRTAAPGADNQPGNDPQS